MPTHIILTCMPGPITWTGGSWSFGCVVDPWLFGWLALGDLGYLVNAQTHGTSTEFVVDLQSGSI